LGNGGVVVAVVVVVGNEVGLEEVAVLVLIIRF
jgi:hypothetical protein